MENAKLLVTHSKHGRASQCSVLKSMPSSLFIENHHLPEYLRTERYTRPEQYLAYPLLVFAKTLVQA
jgi:hypothetical protein